MLLPSLQARSLPPLSSRLLWDAFPVQSTRDPFMDIFLVLYEAEHLSLATHWSCAFVIFSGSFLIPLSLLKGPGLGGYSWLGLSRYWG